MEVDRRLNRLNVRLPIATRGGITGLSLNLTAIHFYFNVDLAYILSYHSYTLSYSTQKDLSQVT